MKRTIVLHIFIKTNNDLDYEKIYTTATIIVISTTIKAQTTAIPDANVEQALINLGYDSGLKDRTVPTGNISTITTLVVQNKNISDLPL